MYLLDTNVISEITKRRPNADVVKWSGAVDPASQFISVLVLGEIRKGAEMLAERDPARARDYLDWLVEVKRDFVDRILPVTDDIALEWGSMNAARTLPAIDGLMAATAKVHGLTFVTRNDSPLRDVGIPLLNPFAPN